MVSLLSPDMIALIERRLAAVRRRKIKIDPVLGPASGIVSRLGSLPKIDGDIIHAAIVDAIRAWTDLIVLPEWRTPISDSADRLAAGGRHATCLVTDLPYDAQVVDTVKVDLVTIDPVTGVATAYEVKRGHGDHDSGKRQKIIDDLIRVRLVLAGHLRECGHTEVRTAAVRLVSYYGCGATGPIPTLTRESIDQHFGVPVTTMVGAAAELMRAAALGILQDELRLLLGPIDGPGGVGSYGGTPQWSWAGRAIHPAPVVSRGHNGVGDMPVIPYASRAIRAGWMPYRRWRRGYYHRMSMIVEVMEMKRFQGLGRCMSVVWNFDQSVVPVGRETGSCRSLLANKSEPLVIS